MNVWLSGLFSVFEGVLVEEGVDDHGPGEVVVACGAEGGEALFEEVEGFFGWGMGCDGCVEADEFFVFGAFLRHEGFGFVLGGLEIFALVHEEEGLEGSVGALATGDAGVAAGGIEDGHLGWGHATLPEGVDGAALGGGVGVCDELVREGAGEGDSFPESVGLRGFDAAAAYFGVENAGDVEELVADNFGVEADAGAAGEEAVFGVGLEVDRATGGGLLVGLGEDYFLHEGFDVPTGIDELKGEVVEEFGVAGPHALSAEVLGSFDEAGAEELLPEAVYGDAGGEGVFFFDEPVGEVHATWDVAGFFKRREEVGGVAGNDIADLGVVSADADVGGVDGLSLAHDHGSADVVEVGGAFFLKSGDLLLGFFDLGFEVGLGSGVWDGGRCGCGLLFIERSAVGLSCFYLRIVVGELCFLVVGGKFDVGWLEAAVEVGAAAAAGFGFAVEIVEEGIHLVEVLLGDRVVFVVVADGAAEGEAHEGGADS